MNNKFTDQLNSHINKTAENLVITIHWWSEQDKYKYHSKINLIKDKYKKEITVKSNKSKVIAILYRTGMSFIAVKSESF